MQVRQIDTHEAADVRQFIELPYRIYKDNPHWVPRLRNEIKQAMDQENYPFYDHGRAAFFLAEDQGRVVGRLTAINNQRYNQFNDTQTGFFHYFEAFEDQPVTDALFGAAFQWFNEQGLTEVLGPKGLLQGDAAGLLVDGFDWRPAMGIPYNLPYYSRLIENLDFEPATDYLSGYIDDVEVLPARLERIAEWVKKRRGFYVQDFSSKDELRQWVPQIKEVYNRSFNQSFTGAIKFVPLTEQEIQVIADRLLALTQPELVKLVMHEDDLVGFLFSYPNIGPAIRRAKGRLWPFGWLRLWWEQRTTRWLDANGVGVLPQYQGSGASAVLYAELARTVRDTRFEHADVVQVREENLKSLGDMEALGVTWYKRHRLYRRSIG